MDKQTRHNLVKIADNKLFRIQSPLELIARRAREGTIRPYIRQIVHMLNKPKYHHNNNIPLS